MYLHYRVLFMSQEEVSLRGIFQEAPGPLPTRTCLCHTKEDKGQGVIWLVIG